MDRATRFRIILRTLTAITGIGMFIVSVTLLAVMGFHNGSRTFYTVMEVMMPLGVLGCLASYLSSAWLGLAMGLFLLAAAALPVVAFPHERDFWLFFLIFGAMAGGMIRTAFVLLFRRETPIP